MSYFDENFPAKPPRPRMAIVSEENRSFFGMFLWIRLKNLHQHAPWKVPVVGKLTHLCNCTCGEKPEHPKIKAQCVFIRIGETALTISLPAFLE